MRSWSPKQFAADAAAARVDPVLSQTAFEQAWRVQSRGLAAILTLNHLAVETGTPYLALRRLVSRGDKRPYRFFRMAKRRGGTRLICVPSYRLRQVQQWVVRNVLRSVPCHPASGAFSPGCSPLSVAKRHCGSRWLVK